MIINAPQPAHSGSLSPKTITVIAGLVVFVGVGVAAVWWARQPGPPLGGEPEAAPVLTEAAWVAPAGDHDAAAAAVGGPRDPMVGATTRMVAAARGLGFTVLDQAVLGDSALLIVKKGGGQPLTVQVRRDWKPGDNNPLAQPLKAEVMAPPVADAGDVSALGLAVREAVKAK